MTTAYIGLGSNLEQPTAQLDRALDALRALPGSRVGQVSRYYRNPPMGPAQPDFVNAVAQLETMLEPLALLDALQAIEQNQGRVRARRWGPRTLDLDLLLYGSQRIELPRLRVPHPGLPRRAFVLQPLAELAPDLRIPGHGDIAALLERVDCSALRPLS